MPKKRRVKMPKDKSLIIILKDNLSEFDAYKHEIYMIDVLGLKTEGGLLRNFTSGGEGCPATPEVKAKISKSLSGRTLSEEHRKNVSLALKGKKQDPEIVKKRADSRKRPITLRSPEGELVTFPSIKECARVLGVLATVISSLKHGRQKTCKGFTYV